MARAEHNLINLPPFWTVFTFTYLTSLHNNVKEVMETLRIKKKNGEAL